MQPEAMSLTPLTCHPFYLQRVSEAWFAAPPVIRAASSCRITLCLGPVPTVD